MSDPILEAVNGTVKHFDYLAGRWSDESEYEEFSDYMKSFEKAFPDFTVVKSTKRPFSFTITHKDAPKRQFVLKATSRHITVQEHVAS
jgi:hypothetical protein